MKKEIVLDLKNMFENYPPFLEELFYKNMLLEKKVLELGEKNIQLVSDLNKMNKKFEVLKKKYYSECKKTLNIFFSLNGIKVNIICNSNDLISTLVNKYKLKTGKKFSEYELRNADKIMFLICLLK